MDIIISHACCGNKSDGEFRLFIGRTYACVHIFLFTSAWLIEKPTELISIIIVRFAMADRRRRERQRQRQSLRQRETKKGEGGRLSHICSQTHVKRCQQLAKSKILNFTQRDLFVTGEWIHASDLYSVGIPEQSD